MTRGGHVILSASHDRSLALHNPKSGQLVCKIEDAHVDKVDSACFSQDTRLIASSASDESIKMWDLNRKEMIC